MSCWMSCVTPEMNKVNDDASVTVPSPCIRHCCLNEDDICLGCFRRLDEITAWSDASNTERLNTLTNACLRRQTANIQPCP